MQSPAYPRERKTDRRGDFEEIKVVDVQVAARSLKVSRVAACPLGNEKVPGHCQEAFGVPG